MVSVYGEWREGVMFLVMFDNFSLATADDQAV